MFRRLLCRIGRERTARCHHCNDRDSAQYTLQEYSAIEEERWVLVASIGADLSLPVIFRNTVGERDKWSLFVSFCGTAMSRKESEERVRRGEVLPNGKAAHARGQVGHAPQRKRRGRDQLVHLRND